MKQLIILLALAGCATTEQASIVPVPTPVQRGPLEIPPPAFGEGQCDSKRVQTFVGKESNAGTTDQIRRQSNSRVARVITPESAVTMDYRSDRVNVTLGRGRQIARINCG